MEENRRRLANSRFRLEVVRHEYRAARLERELLHDTAYARLEAKLATMPVVEQAKGMLIAETGCSPEEAFEMLRRASQRSSRSVHDLAMETMEAAERRQQSRLAVRRGVPPRPTSLA